MPEHLRNFSLTWVAFGWFIAAAIASLVLLALAAFGLAAPDTPSETFWVAVALLFGFFASGLFVGTRVAAAPLLNGIGMGLFSLVAWLLVNVVLGEPIGDATWRSLDAPSLVGLLALQTAAATVGCRMGVRWRRSAPSDLAS